MAALTSTNLRVWKGQLETKKCLILNGQSWKAGQLLRQNTSGLLTVVASNHVAATGGNIYMALSDQADPGNSTTYALVAVVTADTIFLGNEYDTTATAASIGQDAGVNVASNICTVDISAGASYPFFRVVGVLSAEVEPCMNDSADTKARLLVKVLTTIIEATPQA